MQISQKEDLKQDNYLILPLFDKISHFSVFLIPCLIIVMAILLWNNKQIESQLTFILILLIGVFLFYPLFLLQRDKLTFKTIRLDLPHDQIENLVSKTLEDLKWQYYKPIEQVYLATTGNSFTILLKITIIIDNKTVFVNMLDDYGYITSFGKTTRFYKKFTEKILSEYQNEYINRGR
jgi:hypothetical protein